MGIPGRANYRGCLLGGAVGDALGAPVETLSRDRILREFGPKGVTRFPIGHDGAGLITAETQLALFTAEGLIRQWVRGEIKGISTHTGVTANAYLRWLHTQGESPEHQVGLGAPFDDAEPGWLQQQQRLHSRRNPGATCISALRAMRVLGEPANNRSKGCSAVTRMSPVGLFVSRMPGGNDQLAFECGRDLASLTHGHETAKLAAGAYAALIWRLVRGEPLDSALPMVKRLLAGERGHEELLNAIESAELAFSSGESQVSCVARLGQGWVAHEALAIGIYCALVAVSFADGVALAVNHDGDSDSTGAIAGSILGAILGVEDIPGSWLAPLELRHVISEIADDLFDYADWHVSDYDFNDETRRVLTKYPGF